eukprot:TRINITY_DN43_c3_g1_i2.p1 TRINITY_DN43_c3_g1~~TRINITY_DN43_c3_g1_i2.p1  ORF type:complete len:486 (+),score=123.58 TRINITY_DN43_c3_g1_i2:180-1637(+)
MGVASDEVRSSEIESELGKMDQPIKADLAYALHSFSRRLTALRAEGSNMPFVVDGLHVSTLGAIVEVKLEAQEAHEAVSRKELSLLEGLERAGYFSAFTAFQHTRRLERGGEKCRALLRRAEELSTHPADESAAGISAMRDLIHSMRYAESLDDPMSRHIRDILLGSLHPIEGDDTRVTPVQALARATAINPSACTFCNLADHMPAGSSIKLPDGSVMARSDVFKQALVLDRTHWKSLALYGDALDNDEEVTLPSGEVVTKASLFLEAVNRFPGIHFLYQKLGKALCQGDVVELHGEKLTQQQVMKRAIALRPEIPQAYTDLGATLHGNATTTLEDGSVMDKVQLYKRSILLACSGRKSLLPLDIIEEGVARSYNNLANCLPDGGTTELEDGIVMTQEELYKRAIALDPGFSNAYNNLGTCMRFGRLTTLEDGTVLSKQDVFERAIALDPNNQCAVENLDDFDRWSARFSTQGGSSSESRSSHAK